MFFTFSQNNSGGSFVDDEQRGICSTVIIEANDASHANDLAERIGLYFDGCENDSDCPCCGDRWSRMWSDIDGDALPMAFGRPLEEVGPQWYRTHAFVHYLDGRVERVGFKRKEG